MRLLRKISLVLLCLVLALCLTYRLYLEYDNFHPVTPGEAYRSAQLEAGELGTYIKKYRIASVVNLRGPSPESAWYQAERRACRAHGVRHYDLALSAVRIPDSAAIRALRDIYQQAPRPILIHCRAGSDRTGLAAALWKLWVDRAPASEARRQLSIVYWHMPFGEATAMDRAFLRYAHASD